MSFASPSFPRVINETEASPMVVSSPMSHLLLASIARALWLLVSSCHTCHFFVLQLQAGSFHSQQLNAHPPHDLPMHFSYIP